MGSVVVVYAKYALLHVGSSQIRDGTHVPCVGRWILNHWTTQEAPACNFPFYKRKL